MKACIFIGFLVVTLEEIHVGKFFHLLDVNGLDDLFVVEENPLWIRGGCLFDLFANKGHIVSVMALVCWKM